MDTEAYGSKIPAIHDVITPPRPSVNHCTMARKPGLLVSKKLIILLPPCAGNSRKKLAELRLRRTWNALLKHNGFLYPPAVQRTLHRTTHGIDVGACGALSLLGVRYRPYSFFQTIFCFYPATVSTLSVLLLVAHSLPPSIFF